MEGDLFSPNSRRCPMSWEKPTFEALDMGFEVTMYVYNK